MKFNLDGDLIKELYNYDVILLWMDINNSMSKPFLKYIDVNFPDIKKTEIKSGYGDLRKLGTVNEIKTKNMTFCVCYAYKNKDFSIKLLQECSKEVNRLYNNKRIATVSVINNDLFKKVFDWTNLDITVYCKEILDFNLYYYRKFLYLKTKFKKNEINKDEYVEQKNKLETERTKGIY